MKKLLLFFVISIICVVALLYFRPDFSFFQLQQKLGSKGFTVVAVSVDDQGEESVENFVQTEPFPVDGSSATINFPVLLGSEEIARKLGFEGGLPASVLVTRDAKEVKIIRGPFNAQEVSRAIKHLL